MSRAVAGHAASIGVAGAVSFGFAGGLESLLGWRGAFGVAAGCAVTAWLMALLLVPPARRSPTPRHGGWREDVRAVISNRPALAYSVAYCVHTWEMSALRGWDSPGASPSPAWRAARWPGTGAEHTSSGSRHRRA